VFSRGGIDRGSELLLKGIFAKTPAHCSGRMLDLGCGWGAVGVSLACRYPRAELTLCDVNRRALALAQENLIRNRLRGNCVLSDGLVNVSGAFALIALNPPIRSGKATVYRLFEESGRRLEPGGALFVVIRKQQGALSALARLRELFRSADVVLKSGGYWVIKAGAGLTAHEEAVDGSSF
jgi:16S rRNA (guanine1207-N2)-methyltransferase